MTLRASLCSARAWNADFVLGMDMRVQQVGSALEHLVPELHPGVHVKEALQVRAVHALDHEVFCVMAKSVSAIEAVASLS